MLLPRLAPLAAEFDPDNIGGAMLLGRGRGLRHQPRLVEGHGHRLGRRVAHDVATAGLVDRLARAVVSRSRADPTAGGSAKTTSEQGFIGLGGWTR